MVSLRQGWIATSYHGDFEIDGETANLIRISMETDELPSATRACRCFTATDYRYQTVGESVYLLPTHTEFDVTQRNFGKTRSSADFSGCHEFRAESSMSFTEEAPVAAAPTPRPEALDSLPPLPPGLQLTLALLAPIDTKSAAAGDLISARVIKAVQAPGSDKVLVAAGAIVRGRIVQMRHDMRLGKFWIAIRYQTLEQNGAVMPLTVILDSQVHAEQKTKSSLAKRGDEFTLAPQAASGSNPGSFVIPAGKGHAILAAGSQSKWDTVAR
jgi:hypothetical protein